MIIDKRCVQHETNKFTITIKAGRSIEKTLLNNICMRQESEDFKGFRCNSQRSDFFLQYRWRSETKGQSHIIAVKSLYAATAKTVRKLIK